MPKKVAETEREEFDENESCDLGGQGMKNIIPSTKIDFNTRLQVLLTIKFFGLTNIL